MCLFYRTTYWLIEYHLQINRTQGKYSIEQDKGNSEKMMLEPQDQWVHVAYLPMCASKILTPEYRKASFHQSERKPTYTKWNTLNLQLKILESPEYYRTCQIIHNVKRWILNSKFLQQKSFLCCTSSICTAGIDLCPWYCATKHPSVQKNHLWTV